MSLRNLLGPWSVLFNKKEDEQTMQELPSLPKVKRDLEPTIYNVINVLPWHSGNEKYPEGRKWSKRTVSNIDSIIVHQAASTGTIEAINKYHITPTHDRDHDGTIAAWERNHISPDGCPHICYHFVIGKSGRLYQANKVSDLVWHTKGKNSTAIGVLVLGDFAGPSYKGKEVPTPPQLRSLKRLLDLLTNRYSISKLNVKGHCEAQDQKPDCPGNIIMNELISWRIK